jgi:hypothetical protein
MSSSSLSLDYQGDKDELESFLKSANEPEIVGTINP